MDDHMRPRHLRNRNDSCGFCCASAFFITLIVIASGSFGFEILIQMLLVIGVIVASLCVFCIVSCLGSCIGDMFEEEIHKPKEIEMVNIRSKEICSICLEPCKKGVELVCKHKFHKKCIKKWTDENQSCPNCRLPV